MAGRLQDQVALITGAASGIGRACAERFAEEGARLVLADLQDGRAADTLHAVHALGRPAVYVHVDTRRARQTEALARTAVAAFGQIDVVVAAAGVGHGQYVSGDTSQDARRMAARRADPLAASFLREPLRDWRTVLDVNLTGVMLTIRAAARQMLAQGRPGSIIPIASIAGRHPAAGGTSYCVSKAGVWMLAKSASQYLAPHGIRVNAIGPGFIETPMTAALRASPALHDRFMRMTPMRRMGTPREVAATALFLASAESAFITGEMLHPDGGFFTV